MDLEEFSNDFKELFYGVGHKNPAFTLIASDKVCGITPSDNSTKEALGKIDRSSLYEKIRLLHEAEKSERFY